VRRAASRTIRTNAIAIFVKDASATTSDRHLVAGEGTKAKAAERASRWGTRFFDVSPNDLDAPACNAKQRAFTPVNDRQIAEHRRTGAHHFFAGDRDDVSLRVSEHAQERSLTRGTEIGDVRERETLTAYENLMCHYVIDQSTSHRQHREQTCLQLHSRR
jgi:hypothetical protein